MKYLALLLLSLSFIACQRHFPVTPTSAYVNTHWAYIDEDSDFDMTFLEDGTFSHSISADHTPGNDYWYEKNGKLYFFMNDGYSRYTGIVTGPGKVAGTAKNKVGKKWNWEIKQIKE